MRVNNYDERETYSDSDLVIQDERLHVCEDSLFMESLQLESHELEFVPTISFKVTRRLFIPKILRQYAHLQVEYRVEGTFKQWSPKSVSWKTRHPSYRCK